MAAGTPLSAKNAKVRVNGSTLYAVKWDVDPTSDMLDISNFEGGGYRNFIEGLKQATVTVEGWWDGGANPFDVPLSIKNGSILTNFRCYVSDTTGPYWDFPSAIVEGTPMSADVGMEIKWRFTVRAKGTYTFPTGNA